MSLDDVTGEGAALANLELLYAIARAIRAMDEGDPSRYHTERFLHILRVEIEATHYDMMDRKILMALADMFVQMCLGRDP